MISKEKVGRLMPPDFETYCKATAITAGGIGAEQIKDQRREPRVT